MNAFQVTFVIATALIAHSCADYSATPAPATSNYDNSPAAADYGNAKEAIPYSAVNTQNSIISSSVTYPQNKSRVLVYYPASILINRPPTSLVLKHPPYYVQPAPMIVHQPPALVAKKVYVKNYPQSVKVTPLYVNVVKPTESKYYIKEDKPTYTYPTAEYSAPTYSAPADYSAPTYSAPADYSAPAYSAPADYSAPSYSAPAEASYVPAGDAYTTGNAYVPSDAYQPNVAYSADVAAVPASVDVSASPAFAFANQDLAAARAGYQLVQDGQAANALTNLGSNYQAQPAY